MDAGMIWIWAFVIATLKTVRLFAGDLFVVDEDVFLNITDGMLAGFGDYNADKRVDVFLISNNGQNVDVWLASENGLFSKKSLIGTNVKDSDYIVGIMLTDFNGDGFLDVLCSNKSNQNIKLEIYWGSRDGLNYNTQLHPEVVDEPVLFDYDGDGLPDLLVQDLSYNLTVLISNQNQSFENIEFLSQGKLAVPHSSAFVNITSTPNTDLLLTMSEGTFRVFKNNDFSTFFSYKIDDKSGRIGQSSFGDLNQDGLIDHIVPIGNQIQVYFNKSWHILGELNSPYEFDYHNNISTKQGVIHEIPPTLVVGDYDSDGYLDVLTVVRKDNKNIAVLLRNIPCNRGNICTSFGRWLDVQELPEIPDEVHLAAFFDYLEDGSLDILLTTSRKNSTGTRLNTVLLRNVIAADTCFMKVTVTNGLLNKFPLQDKKPYGVNDIGATVFYETIKTNGGVRKSCATQLTQSAHFSLQLPFILFGLGQTPNFVDNIFIALPHKQNKTARLRQWTQIIPNSQLIVHPHKPDDPQSWTMQLFVMPSKQIYTTAAVLGSTCIGLAFIVGGLLWKEHKEDKAEKKQESHRFKFDAM